MRHLAISETLANSKPQQLHADSEDYPALLRELRDRPDPLFVLGDPDVLQLPAIAVVGSRKPTSGGRDNA